MSKESRSIKEGKGTTLLEAAQLFSKENYENSILRQVLFNMIRYGDATRTLIHEMDLLLKDL